MSMDDHPTNQTLRLAVLEGLLPRGVAPGGYSGGYTPLVLDGYTSEEVEAMVKILAHEGLVNMYFFKEGLGVRKHVGGTLTDKGREYLASRARGNRDPAGDGAQPRDSVSDRAEHRRRGRD